MRTLHCHFRERHNQFDGVDDLNWVVWGQWRKVQSCQTYVRTKADMVIAFNTICRTRRVKGSCSVSAISSIRMPHPESMLADGLTFTTFTTCTRRSVMAFLTFKLRRAAIGNSEATSRPLQVPSGRRPRVDTHTPVAKNIPESVERSPHRRRWDDRTGWQR